MSNECRFYPVQCSDATLQTLSPQEGHVYFTTDTKKIFLGKGTGESAKMIPMCAATGFFYGTKYIEPDLSGNTPDPNVTFTFDEIEGDEIPEVDDLILNEDGCFYRVKSVSEDDVATLRLTLQGTGTGGGGGNNSGSSAQYTINAVGGTSKIFSTMATEMLIGFKAVYKGDDADDYISYISCTLSGEEMPFLEMEDVYVPFNEDKYIDLAPYAALFSTVAQKSISLEVRNIYGESRALTYKIKLVEMSIAQTQNNMLYSLTPNYIYDCTVNGGLSLKNRRVIYSFYKDGSSVAMPAKTIEYLTTIDGNVKKELDLSDLTHGTYVMKVQATGNIENTTTTVSSNILTHKIIYFDSAQGTALFSAFLPEKTEQFANIPFTTLLVTGGSAKEYTMELRINGNLETTLKITAHTPLDYNLLFEEKGVYSLTLTVVELNVSYSTILNIVEYTGKLPVIDVNRDDLELYLNPKGKSNNSITRNVWENHNGKFSATLNDFYYGDINGWFTDENGVSYLKLSQGATLTLPEYKPFAKNAMDKSNYGITIELDFKLSSVLDYSKDLIRCLSTDSNGVIYAGFRITGNKAYLYSSIKNGSTGDPVVLNMVEDQRIRITYVVEKNDVDFPMILTYLEGIISNVSKYETTDRFVDAGGDGATPGTLIIDSQYGQIDIYSIRIYSAALEQSVVLGNYQATLGSLAEREESFKSNSILTNNKVDLRYMEDEGYELDIPYIKLTGGYKAADKKVMTMGVSGDEFALPVGKKDFRLISFELKYPKTGYFAEKGYEDFKEMCTFESGKNETSLNPAYGETPLTGAVMYAQGTSSLEYPVKNLRVKFKTKKVAVRPGMEPVNLICLKADFMESSGSHNTGAANYIDDVYKMASMSTPGQQYYKNEDIVTCIKGHPVAVFWSPSGSDGTYEYIGKYNFNLDKATPEPFGFKNTPEKYDATATEKFGWDANGKNVIRCFEYLDNSTMVCNFLPKTGKTYYDTWYESVLESTGDTHFGWTEGFESRHPEDLVKREDADCIYTMASWVNELATLRYGTKVCPTCGEVLAMSNRCLYCQEQDLTDIEYVKEPNEALALARFKNEYECYFNKEYLVGYYLITNLLLMIDSRTKNCMMASWGPEADGFLGNADFKEKFYYPLIQDTNGDWVPNEEAEPVKPGNYIWYPIFYDMDTMLGVDNQGYPRLNYYDEDINPETFNGEDILWNFVRDALPGEVANYYGKFESASSMFAASTILPYFNRNQANLANEALFNGDAEYKYIDTFREGYYDHLNTDAQGNPTFIEPGKGSRLYAAQGNRSLDRQYFITNRVNFLRGKYQSSNYQSGDRIEFRCYVPTGSGEDTPKENALVTDSIAIVPFNKTFNLTALGPGFAGVRFGQNGTIANYQFTNTNRTANVTSDQNPADLESYILGLNNLSDIGDLSNKYLATFTIKYPNKLKRIILGNDHAKYYNPYWKKKKGTNIEVQSCYLLEEFNMYNCGQYRDSLDFTACKQLKKLYLTGCGVTTLILPEGTVIEEMRLPDTLQTLEIKNQGFLTKDNFSIGYYDYDAAESLNIVDKNYFVDTYDNLRYVQILNTPINSYAIATKAPNLQEYHFTDVDWLADKNDTQYCSVKEDEFVANGSYYKYVVSYAEYEGDEFISGLYQKVNEDYVTIQEYEFDENTQYYVKVNSYEPYTTSTFESGLYEKITLLNADGTITRIPVLERLMRIGTKNGIEHSEALTGTLTIDLLCEDGSKPSVNEFDIYYRYNKIYPNLTIKYGDNITGEKAYSIAFYRTDIDNMTDGVTPDYVVMTNGSKTLADLTGENSPAGEPLFTPTKASTNTERYEFADIWIDYDTGTEYAVADFGTITPAKNLKLAPKFNTHIRYYTAQFFDHDGTEVEALHDLQWNEYLGVETAGLAKVHFIYRDDSELGEHERYVLKGWQTEKSFNNPSSNPSLYDLSTLQITEDMKLYAYYEVEDARTNATTMKCFSVNEQKHTLGDTSITALGIDLAAEYQNVIGGKITIPSKYTNGEAIKFISNFSDTPGITKVYFLDDAEYIAITESAFDMAAADSKLTYFEVPSSITHIGKNAFKACHKLVTCDLPNTVVSIGEYAFGANSTSDTMALVMSELPTNLTALGAYAFYRCPNVTFSSIPAGISTIKEWTFASCNNITINSFGGNGSALTNISEYAFRTAGAKSVTTLIFDEPLTTIGSKAFKDGYLGVTNITTHSYFGRASEDAFETELFDDSSRTSSITTNYLPKS